MIGKSTEAEEKISVFQRIRSLLLSKKVVLFAAVLLLLAAIGIAAAARYAANRQNEPASSVSGDVSHDEFYAFLEDYLPQYGVIPQETPLHVPDAAGVFAAYAPAADADLLICRIEGRDLALVRCEKDGSGNVTAAETAVYADVFAAIYDSGESLVIKTEPDGIYAGTKKMLTLSTPDAAPLTVAVIKAEEKSRSWELSSYLFRDMTAFRNAVRLPNERPQTEMPDVADMDWEEAVQRITERGLNPQIETELPPVNSDIPRGQVLAQAPAAGSKCRAGSSVYLTVAAESFVFSFSAPPHTQGDFTAILYDETGTELARTKWHAGGSPEADGEALRCHVWAMKYTQTRNFQAVLENDANGKTVSLGAYTVETDEIAADSAITDYAFTHIGGIQEPEPETTAPPQEPEQPDNSAEWKPLYLKYLKAGLDGGFKLCNLSSIRCEFIDIDGDDIPELAVGATEQNRRVAWICSIVNGTVQETEHFRNGFWYLKGENRIFTELRTSYYAQYLICELREGQPQTLQSFEERWSKTDGYSYRTDARTITRAEYTEAQKKNFELPERTEWNYPVAGWPLNDNNMQKYLQ